MRDAYLQQVQEDDRRALEIKACIESVQGCVCVVSCNSVVFNEFSISNGLIYFYYFRYF